MIIAPRLLLLSSSRIPADTARLHYARPFLSDFLDRPGRDIAFVPYAAVREVDAYVDAARGVFENLGFRFTPVDPRDPSAAIRRADAVCIGGGNTHLLNMRLHETGLREVVRRKVLDEGAPYVGWSAGANVAFGGIETTNDMNIVANVRFEGLGLIGGGLRLSPHFADAVDWDALPEDSRLAFERLLAGSPETVALLRHQGETRQQRIEEYLSLRTPGPVIGLYEGGILRVEGGRMTLTGVAGAKVFEKGKEPSRLEPGSDLSWLLTENP